MNIIQVATGFRFRNGTTFAPWAYKRPDGAVVTVCGSTCAILAVDGHHVDGEPWAFTERPDSARPRRPTGEECEKILNKATETIGAGTVSAWRDLAGVPFAPGEPVKKKCPDCFGTGTRECPHCEQDMKCSECEGEGSFAADPDWPDQRYVRVTGKLFDLQLLAPFLAVLPDGEVTISRGGDLLRLSGAGWRLVAMAVREGDDEKVVVEMPAELLGAAR